LVENKYSDGENYCHDHSSDSIFCPAQNQWKIQTDGSILWEVKQDIPHYDHIKMSGEKVSTVLRYGVNADGSFQLERSLVWPMLRTLPHITLAMYPTCK
jgi:hypothetical protein